MGDSALSHGERRLLGALDRLGVRYLMVGMSAALLQGARGATEDIDLWFATADDPRLAQAATEAGGVYVSGNFGLMPPMFGGLGPDNRFDIVLTASGLDDFDVEYERALSVELDGLNVRVLPLPRILHSKRSAGRLKDLAQIPALEAALAAAEEDE